MRFVVLLSAIGLGASAASAHAQATLPERWMDEIEQLNWQYSGYTSGRFAQFVQPSQRANEVWVRWELRSSEDGFLSARELYAVDCDSWTYGVLEVTLFAERNLRGTVVRYEPDLLWHRAAPDSMVHLIVTYACGSR